jgi:predicted O-methyltransferase YrrM
MDRRRKDRILRAARRLGRATVRQVAASERWHRLDALAKYWVYLGEDSLPTRHLAELWPGIAGISATATIGTAHGWELPYAERAILVALVRYLQPKRIFEFGTFTGSTSCLLADASDENAVVHTIDLPEDQIPYARVRNIIGTNFIGNDTYKNRIKLHRADSKKFNYCSLKEKFDFIFIDASHEYEDVIMDNKNALNILAPEGLIVWDDYQSSQSGVVYALNQLSRDLQLVHVAYSRLVLHRRPAFPNL